MATSPSPASSSHHITYCTGSAQEDYDFHVRLLGLKSIKKTVLFDGDVPIYHLYYANKLEDGFSTVLTAFPYRQQGWMGKRGTNQTKQISVAVPSDSIGFWADRLRSRDVEVQERELFGTQRLLFTDPSGIPFAIVGDPEVRPEVIESRAGVPEEHAIRHQCELHELLRQATVA
jgi:glyoxalase family protein